MSLRGLPTTVKIKRAMLLIGVLGIALTIYLTIVHYAGLKPACTAGQACVKVQTSQWSKLGGVPVALLGLIGDILIVGTLLARDREETRLATLGLTLTGLLFSGYLTYREIFSIKAICEECATHAVFVAILFVGAVWRYLLGDPAPGAPEPAQTRTGPRAAVGA